MLGIRESIRCLFKTQKRLWSHNCQYAVALLPQKLSIKFFIKKVFRGDLCKAIQFLTEREKRGVVLPKERCSKTQQPALEVLKGKHPSGKTSNPSHFPFFEETPEFVDIDITEDTVEKVSSNLSGAGGLGGTYSLTLKHWLLNFGQESKRLCQVITEFTKLLLNESPS